MGFSTGNRDDRPPIELKPKWYPSTSRCEELNHIPAMPNVKDARVPARYAAHLEKYLTLRQKQINHQTIQELKNARKIHEHSVLRFCPTSRYLGPTNFDQTD